MDKFDKEYQELKEITALNEKFKRFKEGVSYDSLETQDVAFNVRQVHLDDVKSMDEVMYEMNEVSTQIYVYGSLSEMQNRVVQLLEDEFERWKALTIVDNKLDDRQYKTDKAKDRFLIHTFKENYIHYTEALANEKYKQSLLNRVVKSLESYSYKLHAIKDYNMARERT